MSVARAFVELMSAQLLRTPRMVAFAAAFVAAVSGTSLKGAQTDPQSMTQAEVNDALFDDPEIFNGLLLASMVYHIVETCDELLPPSRMSRTIYFLGLYQRARSMGFSHSQLESFVEDEGQQDRMRDYVYRYAEQNGARPENREDICALGRAEMAANSPVGRRLRER